MGIRTSNTIFAGQLLQNRGLKSTQERAERQQKANSQIAFWEGQKASLKEMECETVDDIAQKLEMFHTYEDQIAAVKAAYNREQLDHVFDEAEEVGRKIAEAAEKLEAKTPEERKAERLKEIAGETSGTEQNTGILEEAIEEAAAKLEEMQEELLEEKAAEAVFDDSEDIAQQTQAVEDMEDGKSLVQAEGMPYGCDGLLEADEWNKLYRPVDFRA